MDGWREGLDPWTPVLRDGRLYGRGAADDGYAAFASVTAIEALRRAGGPARALRDPHRGLRGERQRRPARLHRGAGGAHRNARASSSASTPAAATTSSSGCTTSLRGLVTGDLCVATLTEGVHSGGARGIVPSSFRILRQLLSRLEDERTGEILPPSLHVEIPEERRRQAGAAAAVLGASVYETLPVRGGRAAAVSGDVDRAGAQPHLASGAGDHRGGRAAAARRAPATSCARRPRSGSRIRLPPTLPAAPAAAAIRDLFESDPPVRGAGQLRGRAERLGLERAAVAAVAGGVAVARLARAVSAATSAIMGEGGSIPFMAMLGERFPARPVRHHRRARPALERTRAERVPRPGDGGEADRLHRPRPRRPRPRAAVGSLKQRQPRSSS